ncbi:hypothetical protein F8388_012628 [Cannabis sativa]|uniref:NAC domain-containing protein n=1 Tax=Cannabis sativa TaxID=3483 RepID=A0A7J6HVA9_CANSA|nr:hypothetical protein F8388_012628 [Cannabis sativa]KAF4398739.1 hypothetical protein G4B88_017165 [Cannabis sativa]
MTWCNDQSEDVRPNIHIITAPTSNNDASTTNNINNTTSLVTNTKSIVVPDQSRSTTITCPSCGHHIEFQDQAGIHDLPGLPAGVKFDPTDQEILEHLEAKVHSDISGKLHPLIDEFIPTLEGENGICYTHPEKLPGVSKDGQIRHFFHRPSKAYTTGTRKRRKVNTDEDGSETRWHKTGKTRPVFIGGGVKGFKKILVLYTNYGSHNRESPPQLIPNLVVQGDGSSFIHRLTTDASKGKLS